MLTIFAIPKPFRGHTAVIQRNAVRSWTLLEPAPEVILFGDDEGTVETAHEFGARSIPDIPRNEHGTPFIRDLFLLAQKEASHETLCYVNADIIFMNDLLHAVRRVPFPRFLLVGQRWNLDVREALDFQGDWQSALLARVQANGSLFIPDGMDYFVFPRNLYPEMPPFLVGRPTWDQWVICQARRMRIPVIDATEAVTIVHQNHDYAHVPAGDGKSYNGPEGDYNRSLWDNRNFGFSVHDATYRMTRDRLGRDWRYPRLKRNLDSLPVLFPPLTPWIERPRRIFSRLFLQPFRKRIN